MVDGANHFQKKIPKNRKCQFSRTEDGAERLPETETASVRNTGARRFYLRHQPGAESAGGNSSDRRRENRLFQKRRFSSGEIDLNVIRDKVRIFSDHFAMTDCTPFI